MEKNEGLKDPNKKLAMISKESEGNIGVTYRKIEVAGNVEKRSIPNIG